MKIAVIQINPLISDFKGQFERIVDACGQAAAAGADLAVFPELALCGYPPRDLLEQQIFVDANQRCLDRLVQTVRGIGVVCGLVTRNTSEAGKPLFNSAVLFEEGRVLHQVHKQLLPSYDVFDEQRYFEPGPSSRPVAYKGQRIGLTICEDAWNDKDVFRRRLYALDPVEQLAADGMDLLINIAASPFARGKRAFREGLLAKMARKHKVPVVFANQVGGNDHILFDGAGVVFSPQGEPMARCADFEEDRVIYDTVEGCGEMHAVTTPDTRAVFRALVMGTRDYLRKCGIGRAVVGSSGGIDSALVACVAARALGPENVDTVFMPSRHTSPDNYEDTRALARNLGIGYSVIPIDVLYEAFVKVLLSDADRGSPTVTEQNIQARVRGTLLMGISNRDGCLVLSTGNKSELAVGYCTLYGDMNGGLAVISDVYKTLVYDICHMLNQEQELIPRRILQKAPSAELRPDQTDQDDLPPYGVLDAILEGYIEQLQSLDALVAAGHDPRTVAEVIALVERNEYKRHQAAPCLKVTAKAFGEGRRYPVAKRFTTVD
ncbi:NAD+ synthase [Desulfatitalea alkaliphila]|uniref:Glutamine-dependent NAD(+) synthetase n=1 Tax=Desulfatitalea alkaliphila TaxID=2929485 RepID=A0AA41RAM4_9BACT|nr:NAD+ synthase [Desulfatitalea alkaliphila]MCJ8501683.1 NAD+ synthase [Desulfatitalea alkaliphila]